MQTGDLLCGTYRIIQPIAQGGLGTIYLAWHENLQKHVVVKKIRDHITQLVNCRIEADILKSLHHPYLPQVYDFIETGDGIYTVMDYIPGSDLKYYLELGCQVSEAQALLWLRQLLEVLDYLHTRRPPIIHCDIKPANIMITDSGDICLIDFNISLDGENSKELVGVSSRYASPEQIRRADLLLKGLEHGRITVDARSDLYSLGAVFYRLLSGFSPEDRRIYGIWLKHRELPFDSSLVNIIDKAMMTEPAMRFKSARQMLDALDHQEQWTRSYVRLKLLGRAADSVMLFLTIICMGLMIHSYGRMKNTAFYDSYDVYIQEAHALYDPLIDDDTYTAILRDGAALLERTDYSGIWEAHAREKSNVLYSMGQACMGLEQYVQAEAYLKEALDHDQGNVDIYRDLAVVSAMLNKADQALAYMDEACGLGLSSIDAVLVRGQIDFWNGDYEAAYALAVKAAGGYDESIAVRAAILAVQCSRELGNYEECLQFTWKMAARSREPAASLWIQKSGELAVLALEHGSTDPSLLTQGIECYETLRAKEYARLEDLFNLAWLYEKADRLDEGEGLLLSMRTLYPRDHGIPMRLAYIYYRMENQKQPEFRDYSGVAANYAAALKLCSETGVDAGTDAGMVQLSQIIDELEQKGWLDADK